MDIRINGEAVEFTLENERTLGEVMQGIEAWMKDSRLVLASAALDDRDLLGQPARTWQDLPVPEAGTLHLILRLEQEVKIANLKTVIEFLDLLAAALRERDAGRLEGLRADLPLLTESLRRQLAGLERQSDRVEWLGRRFGAPGAEQVRGWSAAEREEAEEVIRGLREAAAALLLELEDPLQALRRVVETMEHTIAELGEVSLLLQTGKDRQAMESILRFSDLFEDLVRIFSWFEEPRRPIGLTGEINGYLRELIEAFQNGDSVLIGDLLEYEVAPRLAALKSHAESML